MHILLASIVINLGNAAMIGFCALGIAFMLRFLVALTREQKVSLVSCRMEYKISSSLPDAAAGQLRPSMQPKRSQGEYDRGEVFPGTPQALKEVALTRGIQFTGSSWQEPNRA